MSRARDTALVLVASLLAAANAEAGLDKVVGSAVRANYEAIHACYRGTVLTRDRNRGGTLFVRVTLGQNDAVRTAQAARDELQSPELSACVLGWVRGWTLRGAAAAGAGPGSELLLPLTFRPVPDQIAVRGLEVKGRALGGEGTVWARKLLSEKNSGARLAELDHLELDGKITLGGKQPLALLLLEGKAKPLEQPGRRPQRLGAGSALWIPSGAQAALAGKLHALLVLLPQDAATGAVLVAPPGRPRKLLGGKLRLTPLLNRTGLKHRALYLGLLAAEAGVHLPAHEHAREAELIYLRSGRARIKLDAERSLELGAGTAIHLRPGARHEVEILERVEAVQVFVPGGPEDQSAGWKR